MTASQAPTSGTGSVPVPRLPALRLRSFVGESDFPGMLAAGAAASAANGQRQSWSLDSMRHQYAHLVNSDAARDVLIAEMDGRVVAYGRVYWTDETDGSRAYNSFCFVHPDVRRHGVGRAMLRHNEARLRETAAGHPADRPRWLSSFAYDADPGAGALLQSEGYRPVRYSFDMERPTLEDLPGAPLPEGLELRPVEPGHLRAIWEADVEAFLDHWGEREDSEEAFERFRTDPRNDPSLWAVAWDRDQVAGVVLGVIDDEANETWNRRHGHVGSVATRRPWRRRGLARALLTEVLRRFAARGMTSAGLDVDGLNPTGALALYEDVGFLVTARSATYRKPVDAAPGR